MTSTELEGEVALLRVMTTGELRAKYLEVFGEPSPSRHRERLVRRIAWKIQALAEGDLSERARRRAKEMANDADLRIRMPAAKSEVTAIETAVTAFSPEAKTAAVSRHNLPRAGTIITKNYHGRQLRVIVRENGFEFENQRFGSLYAIARHITGTQWNAATASSALPGKEAPSESQESRREKDDPVRHLYPQINRRGAGSGFQHPRRSAGSRRGVHQEPGVRGLDSPPSIL